MDTTIVALNKHAPAKRRPAARPSLPQYDPSRVGTDELLNVDILNVDPTYQRPLDLLHVRTIASNFDPTKLFRIAVNRRPDGTYWIMDGQQRVGAIRSLGGNYTIDCVVYDFATVAEEAAFFRHINEERKNTNAMDKWRAQLAEGNPNVVRIQCEMDHAGLRLGNVPNSIITIRAVGTVNAWTEKDVEAMSVVIMILGKIARHMPIDGIVVSGLCYAENFLRQQGCSLVRARTARETFANFIINKGYSELHEACMIYQRQTGLGGGQASRAKLAARGIIELANYKMRNNLLPTIS